MGLSRGDHNEGLFFVHTHQQFYMHAVFKIVRGRLTPVLHCGALGGGRAAPPRSCFLLGVPRGVSHGCLGAQARVPRAATRRNTEGGSWAATSTRSGTFTAPESTRRSSAPGPTGMPTASTSSARSGTFIAT